MKKIIIIGGGAMGSAFTIPCLENNNKVLLQNLIVKDLLKIYHQKINFIHL